MANPYADFLELLPSKKQYIGRVVSVDLTLKTSYVSILGGGGLTVAGVGTVDAKYLIDNGTLLQELPELPVFNVTIY